MLTVTPQGLAGRRSRIPVTAPPRSLLVEGLIVRLYRSVVRLNAKERGSPCPPVSRNACAPLALVFSDRAQYLTYAHGPAGRDSRQIRPKARIRPMSHLYQPRLAPVDVSFTRQRIE